MSFTLPLLSAFFVWIYCRTKADSERDSNNDPIWIVKKALRFANGMKQFMSFRKFYQMVILITLLAVQYVDIVSSTEIARFVVNHRYNTEEAIDSFRLFGSLLTDPLAATTAATFVVIFFFYEASDFFLSMLSKKRNYIFMAICAIVIGLFFHRWFILSETISILLLGAFYYPPLIREDGPRSKKSSSIKKTCLSKAA